MLSPMGTPVTQDKRPGPGVRGCKQERAGLSRAKPAHGTSRQVQPRLGCRAPAPAHPPRRRSGGSRDKGPRSRAGRGVPCEVLRRQGAPGLGLAEMGMQEACSTPSS